MRCPKCKSDNPETQQFCGKCGTRLVPAKDIAALSTRSRETPRLELTTGSVFAGRYKIVEELGEGGMGKVYKVIDQQLNEEVALKLIRSFHYDGVCSGSGSEGADQAVRATGDRNNNIDS
jgi:serine/threonine-protein kinase